MARRENWLFLAVIYLAWAAAIWFHQHLPFWFLMPIGAVLLAWHSSFQHEAIHGHLAVRPWVNDLLAFPPLSLWLPFPIYRRSHRAHHRFDVLTDPYRDPESFYVDPKRWAALPRLAQALLTWHNTLPGRLLLGPFLTIGQFLYEECRAILAGDRRHLQAWLWHLPAAALVLFFITVICAMPLWLYLIAFVLPGLSLTMVRSFAEHKAAHTPFERTAIVEAGPFFSLLFLNNNLHFAHHRRPDLPWQDLPEYYEAHREDLLEENGRLLYRGYLDIARRFSIHPVDRPAHPHM